MTQLAARYNAPGPEALGDQRRRNGRAGSLLTPELLAALAERLKRPPEDGGVWSGPEVAAWMARHLGLQKVHPQRALVRAADGRMRLRGVAGGASVTGPLDVPVAGATKEAK